MPVTPPSSTTTLAGTLVSALLLTGCGSAGISLPTSDGDVSVARDGSEVRIQSDEGSFVAGSDALPEGFPEAEVPVVDGQIISSMRLDEGSTSAWSVTVLTAPGTDPVPRATSALEASGFTTGSSQDLPGMRVVELTNDVYRVVLGTIDQGDQVAVQYTVHAVDG